MSHPGVAPRITSAAIVVLALLVGGLSDLRAQDAAVAAAPGLSAVASTATEPAATTGPSITPVAESGPRVVPPLERYQPSLSPGEASERPAMASGGSHTVVISTLALVLIVIIVVLLVVD